MAGKDQALGSVLGAPQVFDGGIIQLSAAVGSSLGVINRQIAGVEQDFERNALAFSAFDEDIGSRPIAGMQPEVGTP